MFIMFIAGTKERAYNGFLGLANGVGKGLQFF